MNREDFIRYFDEVLDRYDEDEATKEEENFLWRLYDSLCETLRFS